MTADVKKVFQQVLELEEKDRVALAALLIESLDEGAEEGVEKAWAAEVERRMAALDSGKVKPIPWEEVQSRLWQGLDGGQET